MNEKIFALDIGTRSVVGIILEKNGEQFQVADLISMEHKERSMLDGQIHDVLSVANVIKEVKEALEEKHGSLKKVCVAAAGRALKTQQTKSVKNIENQPLMTEEDILHLELSAVQKAQYELAQHEKEEDSTSYYCVGYSVLHYHLDGDEIGSLIDQQGKEASVEIIATFLPKVVVESLISALQRADLEMDALTLEPIAAIHVLIPKSMRRLNVALVDIGAGTSDIAITNYGTVTAYGMVPVAGDEITEALSDQYLLDFPKAEEIKRKLSKSEQVKIVDILGFETELPYEEVVGSIAPAIDKLARAISEEILRLNQKPPQAVMLVGGGSLTPELTGRLSELLKLPNNRVAVRGTEAIQNLKNSEAIPGGPAFVTPIGIAIAAKENPVHYISVNVNERTVRLFDLKQLTIGDCLLSAGIELKRLYGKPGMAYTIKLNGKDMTIPGTFGASPTILLNDQEASLKSPVKHGDQISVERGKDGQSPDMTIHELIGEIPPLDISFNGKWHQVNPQIFVNGKKRDKDYTVQDRDVIQVKPVKTIKDFLEITKNHHYIKETEPFTLFVDKEKIQLDRKVISITKNGKPVHLNDPLKQKDQLNINRLTSVPLKEITDLLNMDINEQMPVIFESEKIILTKPKVSIFRDGVQLHEEEPVFPGDQLFTKQHRAEPFIFQDIFRYIDLNLSDIKGKRFKIYINGEEAGFSDHLSPGDELEIVWHESFPSYNKKLSR
ncbi:MAG: cell division protein FtsA [Bacillaceae bacterium]|nr:cell division protein FtsA [Bacillaceae bacterium]